MINFNEYGRWIAQLVIYVPVVFFWTIAASAFFSPESFQNHDLGEIFRAAKFCIPLSVIMLCGMFIVGYRFGFKNMYSDDVARYLREYLKTPAVGDISIYRVRDAAIPHAPEKSC